MKRIRISPTKRKAMRRCPSKGLKSMKIPRRVSMKNSRRYLRGGLYRRLDYLLLQVELMWILICS
jgi:hypothetical protein